MPQCYVIPTLSVLLHMQNLSVRRAQNSEFSVVIGNSSNSVQKGSYGTRFRDARITLCFRLYEDVRVTTRLFKTIILDNMGNCNCK